MNIARGKVLRQEIARNWMPDVDIRQLQLIAPPLDIGETWSSSHKRKQNARIVAQLIGGSKNGVKFVC